MLKMHVKIHDPATPAAAARHAMAPHEQRLYQVVAQRIREVVRLEGIAPGARLPSERELAARLNVSRPSLREALIALELGGEVEVRSGSGVYLASGDGGKAAVAEAGPGPFEVLAARRMLEPELAATAARVATDAAIDTIMAAARDMEREHGDPPGSERADRLFHRSIALATGNSAMVGLLDYLWDQRGTLWLALQEHFQTEALRKETLADHREIVQAIAMHDPARARHAMRAHLERVTRTLSRG